MPAASTFFRVPAIQEEVDRSHRADDQGSGAVVAVRSFSAYELVTAHVERIEKTRQAG